MKHDLGQLPESDRNDELEELSVQALTGAFPVDRFRIRVEPGKDRGADRYLEIKVSGNDTNCRSQIQLKSKEAATPNADGSESKSIDVSNLNYMLNGPCPMYVLFIASTGKLSYAWARDEAARLDGDTPGWMSAGTVTIRFIEPLDAAALEEIHTRILSEARLTRSVQARITAASRSESPRFQIEPDRTITDAITAKTRILEAGATIVASGYPQFIIDMYGLLSEEDQRQPRVKLVLAYAEYGLNRYDLAMGHIRECLTVADQLAADDNWLLKEIENACQYKLGRKSKREFHDASSKNSQVRGGALAAYAQLDELRYRHLATRDASDRSALLGAMIGLVKGIGRAEDASTVLTLSAEVMLLYSTGQEVVASFLHSIGNQAIRSEIPTRGMPNAVTEATEVFHAWNRWHAEAVDILVRARAANHPILVADSEYTRAAVSGAFLVNAVAGSELGWIERPDWLQRLAADAMTDAESAVAVYSAAGCIESSMRARLVLAELQELAGTPSVAVETAAQSHPICVAMGYEDLARQAAAIKSGRSHLATLLSQLRNAADEDPDDIAASMTDEDAFGTARELANTMGLPRDRIQNILQDVLSQRRLAIERRSWCRHLKLLQHLGHTQDATTAYAEVPDFQCVCSLLGHRSQGSSDWSPLIDHFKESHCQPCARRELKSVRDQ